MKEKSIECQKIRIRSYQDQDDYVEIDQIWYQYCDRKAWHGQVSVFFAKVKIQFGFIAIKRKEKWQCVRQNLINQCKKTGENVEKMDNIQKGAENNKS